MKKNIKTYEELLTSLALSGDSAAFHSLVEPVLRSYYVKMVSEGMKHGDVSEKLCEKAAALYKAFLVSGKNPIDSISESDSEFEKNNEHSGETDFLQSDVINDGEQQFSRELMHALQLFKRRYKGKFRTVRKRPFGITFSKRTWLFTVSIIAVIAGVFAYLNLFSSGGFDARIVKKSKNSVNGSHAKENDTLVKYDGATMIHDTLRHVALKDTVPKIDTVSKPKPKPRRTETSQPAGSAEILNAFDASPVAQPKIIKEQSTQVQTPPDASVSPSQAGGSENSTKSSTTPVAPQPSTQSQDSSWGF
jgi:hypothetical protein